MANSYLFIYCHDNSNVRSSQTRAFLEVATDKDQEPTIYNVERI